MLDESMLRAMLPLAGNRLNAHLPYIAPALDKGGIVEPLDVAAFMAQLAHESGEYRYMEEIADGWAYEGRADLGNTHTGDGPRFKGHGPIQVTGRDNHRRCGQALGVDLEADPTLLTLPKYGTAGAVWFWTHNQIGKLALRGWFMATTKVVNGGHTHLEERIAYYQRNLSLLGLPPYKKQIELESIAQFQAQNGLLVDGDFGPKTFAAVKALP